MSFATSPIQTLEPEPASARKFITQLQEFLQEEQTKFFADPNINDNAVRHLPHVLAVKTMEKVWNMLTDESSATFMVQNSPDVGFSDTELLTAVTFEDFAQIAEDPSHINSEMISFTSLHSSGLSFLRILADSVLNTVYTGENLHQQLIRRVLVVFTGANRFGVDFQLLEYLGESEQDEPMFTKDITPFLIY